MTEYRNPDALVDIDWLQDHLDDPDVRIVEVDEDTTLYEKGHSLYAGENVTGEGETIAYCRIGERSSHMRFVLSELLGYPDVKNYDGSWTEYGSMVGVPVER